MNTCQEKGANQKLRSMPGFITQQPDVGKQKIDGSTQGPEEGQAGDCWSRGIKSL